MKVCITKGLNTVYVYEYSMGRKVVPLPSNYMESTDDLAYIVGVLMGDGHISTQNLIVLGTVDKEFAEAFRLALGRWLNRKIPELRCYEVGKVKFPDGKLHSCRPVFIASVGSRPASEFLKSLLSMATTWVRTLPVNFQLSWLRGIWDSEGCIINHRNAGNRLIFGTIDLELTELYREILKTSCGIETALVRSPRKPPRSTMWYACSYQKERCIEFFKLVQPTVIRKRVIFERMMSYTPPTREQLSERGRLAQKEWMKISTPEQRRKNALKAARKSVETIMTTWTQEQRTERARKAGIARAIKAGQRAR